jgi:hypothetical protein
MWGAVPSSILGGRIRISHNEEVEASLARLLPNFRHTHQQSLPPQRIFRLGYVLIDTDNPPRLRHQLQVQLKV